MEKLNVGDKTPIFAQEEPELEEDSFVLTMVADEPELFDAPPQEIIDKLKGVAGSLEYAQQQINAWTALKTGQPTILIPVPWNFELYDLFERFGPTLTLNGYSVYTHGASIDFLGHNIPTFTLKMINALPWAVKGETGILHIVEKPDNYVEDGSVCVSVNGRIMYFKVEYTSLSGSVEAKNDEQ